MSMLPPKPPTTVDEQDLDQLQSELERDPEGTLEVMGHTIRRHVEEEQVHMSVARLKAALAHPEAARALREATRSERTMRALGAWTPPPGATVFPDIPIDPRDTSSKRPAISTAGSLTARSGGCDRSAALCRPLRDRSTRQRSRFAT